MKKIVIGAVYILWGTIVLLLSSTPYISAKFNHFDVLMLGSIIVALAIYLQLRDFKGTFPYKFILIYTLCLLVVANVVGLFCTGLIHLFGFA